MADHRAIRLFVEADLFAGAPVGLSPDQSHYVRHVMRRRPGDRVVLFNGRDGEWAAVIEGEGKGWTALVVESRDRKSVV